MFDIGMAEMVVIGVVALIVVGPKDLPMMFRKVGQFVGRMRGMARDFQRAMDQAADDSGLKEASDAMKMATSAKNLGLDQVMKTTAAAQASLKTSKTADPLAEHQARVKAVEEANEAAKTWDYGSEGGADAGAADVPDAEPEPAKKKPAAKKTATKKPASKSASKTAAKKTAAKPKTAAAKSTATKTTAKTAGSKTAKTTGKTTTRRRTTGKTSKAET